MSEYKTFRILVLHIEETPVTEPNNKLFRMSEADAAGATSITLRPRRAHLFGSRHPVIRPAHDQLLPDKIQRKHSRKAKIRNPDANFGDGQSTS